MEFVIVILIVLLCYRYHYDQYHNLHFITIIIIVMNMNLFFYNLCIFFPLLKIYHCDRIRGIWNIFTLRDQKNGPWNSPFPADSAWQGDATRGYAWLEFISIMHGSTLEISAVLYLSSFYRTRNRYLHFTSRTFVADVEFSVWFLRGVLEFARKITRAPGLKVTR